MEFQNNDTSEASSSYLMFGIFILRGRQSWGADRLSASTGGCNGRIRLRLRAYRGELLYSSLNKRHCASGRRGTLVEDNASKTENLRKIGGRSQYKWKKRQTVVKSRANDC